MFRVLLILTAVPSSLPQFDTLPDFPPPPWRHRHHPFSPFDHWPHHPPWQTFHFPPTSDFISPPSEHPSPTLTSTVSVPRPRNSPNRYTQDMQKVIKSINKQSEHFSKPGENYENVINVLKSFYERKSGVQYDVLTFEPPAVVGKSELTANHQTAGVLYENDVVLTLMQARMITTQTSRAKRKIIRDLSKRWPRSISFRFQENDEEWKTSIRSALSVFTSSTCLSFIENGPSSDYLIFTRGGGCYSSIGKLGGSQEISIGHGCEGEGVVSHEIAHSIGLWHEQSRSDRDSYVKIFPENVINGAKAQFERLNSSISTDYDLPYDYGSVMHYPTHAFVKESGLTSIEPIDKSFKNTVGSRISLSFLDIRAINAAYCSNVCPRTLPCQNNGYPHPNACTRCLCPSGFSGKFCENLEYSEHGSELQGEDHWKILSFKGSQHSYWRIRVPRGDKIAFELTSVSFKCAPSCEEFVEIKHSYRMDLTGCRLCCRQDFGQRTSFSNQVIIIAYATSLSNFTLNYKRMPQHRTQLMPHPQPTNYLRESSRWSGWSGWSACSEACGACGKQERSRSCLSGNCKTRRRQSQTRTCNLHPCSSGTTRRGGRRSVSVNDRRSQHSRLRRQASWCCAGYKKTAGNWCSQV